MSSIVFATGFNHDRDAVSLASGLACEDPSLARQSEAEDADINTIVKRFGLTGELPPNFRPPTFADFEGVVDFHTAMNAVRDAGERFMAMPPELRARFDNDPQRLIAFLGDESNRQAAVDLGLLVPPPEPPSAAPTPAPAGG